MNEDQLVRACCAQIERELHWGAAAQWNTPDFEKLSELIAGRTRTRLSVSTLKRVWGKVNYESMPSITTLNTLAQHAGYENWRDFQQKNTAMQETTPPPLPAVEVRKIAWWLRPQLRKTIFMLFLILTGLVVHFFFRSPN